MGPYWDPCCTQQLSALSLFCSLLVVLATELAHRNREGSRGERGRARSQQHVAVFTTANRNATDSCSCTVNCSALVVFTQTLRGEKKTFSCQRRKKKKKKGCFKKKACAQYPDIRRKQEEMDLLFTDYENKRHSGKKGPSYIVHEVFKLHTYCTQCGEAPLAQTEHVNTLMGQRPRETWPQSKYYIIFTSGQLDPQDSKYKLCKFYCWFNKKKKKNHLFL